jgi:protein-S-isoprenylcysteine O-methyltransferase Ste14
MNERPPILPPSLGLLMMLGVFTFHFARPLVVFFVYPLNYIGIVPIALGAILNILADKEMQKKGVIGVSGRLNGDENILVTSGVYKLTRNPSYLGLVLIISGMALWVGSLSPWLVVSIFPVILYRFYIKAEESKLLEQFGEQYEHYCDRVPRWILR